MEEYIQLYKIEKDELKKKIAEDFNVPYEDINGEFLEFMGKFVEAKYSADEYIKSSMEIPPSPRDTISLLIPRIYYHVNVRKTTWMTIGLLFGFVYNEKCRYIFFVGAWSSRANYRQT